MRSIKTLLMGLLACVPLIIMPFFTSGCVTDFNQQDFCVENPQDPGCSLTSSDDGDGNDVVAETSDTPQDTPVTDDGDETAADDLDDTEDESDGIEVTDQTDEGDTDINETDKGNDSSEEVLVCQEDDDCLDLDDGDLCNDRYECIEGECVFDDTTLECSDGIDCTEDSCDKLSGCIYKPNNKLCFDDNICTTDVCGEQGCEKSPNISPCNDEDTCTIQDICIDGVCVGTPVTCEDNNPCTNDGCFDGKCIHTPSNEPCNDLNKCTKDDKCTTEGCKGNPVSCEDGINCTSDTCLDKVGCVFTPQVELCDDADTCTIDVCDPESGCTYSLNNGLCEDGNICTADICVENTCSNPPVDGLCDDGTDCTENDACLNGKCVGELKCDCMSDNDCDPFEDNNKCNGTLVCNLSVNKCEVDPDTIITCSSELNTFCLKNMCSPTTGLCEFKAVNEGKECDEDDECVVDFICVEGACSGAVVLCDDGITCTTEACIDGLGCEITINNDKCDDGVECTTDLCDSDKGCIALADQEACNDENVCTTDECDLEEGCINLNITGDDCSDGNSCTKDDSCNDGVCVGVNICQCQNNADCGPLEDGNLCNGTLVCNLSTNKCEVDPKTKVTCNGTLNTQCTDTACVPSTGKCETSNHPNGAECDDNNACTTGEKCVEGLCSESKPTNCNDQNVCTTDGCDNETGCTHESLSDISCDDSKEVTITDTCVDGTCTGITPYHENFEDGVADGWTLGSTPDDSIEWKVILDEGIGSHVLALVVNQSISLEGTVLISALLPLIDTPNSENPKLQFLRWGSQPCNKAKLAMFVDGKEKDGYCGSESFTGSYVQLPTFKSDVPSHFRATLQPGNYNPGAVFQLNSFLVKAN